MSDEVKVEANDKPKDTNDEGKERLQEISVAYYNAATKIVDAGALVMPYNNPLGTMIIKMAEALSVQVGMMTGLDRNDSNGSNGNNGKSCGTGQGNSQLPKELSQDIIDEVSDLEAELEGELGDL